MLRDAQLLKRRPFFSFLNTSLSGSSWTTTLTGYLAGPSDALTTAQKVDDGATLDSGNVCRNQKEGFIYVWNQCAVPATVTIKASHPSSCLSRVIYTALH